jgi:phospholipase C
VIRFLERWTGVREPNISSWRRTACGDLTSAFDFGRGYQQPSVDAPGPVPAPIARWKPTPPADQAVPQQVRGKQTRELSWPTDHGWYDVEVTAAEDTSYRRRLTGHLETGKPSVTG